VEGLRVSHYRLLRRLGSGGMGEVYAAEDERLRRQVAIKFISRERAVDEPALRRFEHEAQAASALNHPNICTIHEVNEHEGQPFLVMELLEGQDLRQVCAAGPVEISKLLQWGIEVADALASAHARGIVHRDIKPANVFITSRGDAKVVDFGLAKLPQREPTGLGETASAAETRLGSVIGTVAYMSPEQARGESLDARTDLFSAGAVLYEMASGKPAFDGSTPAVVYSAILTATPIPISGVRANFPAELERIIAKALEKDQEMRYQSAAELKADLKRLQRELETGSAHRTAAGRAIRSKLLVASIAGLALALLAGAAGWLLTHRRAESVQQLSRRATVAVLPFRNTTGDAKLDYLSTALPDEVVTALSYAPTLSVRPFSMSQRFTGSNSDPHQAGQELKVSDVVTGHFLRQGDRLGVTLEAVDIAKDEVSWRSSVDIATNDMVGLRQEVTTALQRGLLPALGIANIELSRTKPKSQEAYELYLRSQDSPYWTVAHNHEAIAILEKSVALDPGYAPAWLALGLHYANNSDLIGGGEEMYRKTVTALQRAHELDSDLLAASTMLIERRAFYEDLASSFTQIQELARKRPRTAWVHEVFSELLRAAGAPEQAARECEIVRQLDPQFYTGSCVVLYVHMGNFVKARQEINRTPGDFNTMMLGQILLREGRVEEALPKLNTIPAGMQRELIRDCWPDSSTEKCATTARQSEASFRAITFSDAWYFGAALQAFLNKKDSAIQLLRAATEHNLCVYPSVDLDPLFDKIRNSVEFNAVRQEGIACQDRFAPYTKMQIE